MLSGRLREGGATERQLHRKMHLSARSGRAGRLAWGLPKRARVATQYGSLDDLFKIVRYAEPATIVNRREKVPLTGICGQERAHRTLDEPPSSARGSRFSGP